MNISNAPHPNESLAIRMLQEALGEIAAVRHASAERQRSANDWAIHTGGRVFIVQVKRAKPTAVARREDHVVWVFDRATPAQRRFLRDVGANYVDLSGSVRLVLPPLAIDRTDLTPRKPLGVPADADPFTDRRSLVSRVLLTAPKREWNIRALAEAAGVSVGTASQVVRSLADDGVVAHGGRGRAAKGIRLTDRMGLLRLWFAEYEWTRNRRVAFAAPIGAPGRFLPRLPKSLGETRWALALQAGASLVAPHASWERVHAYVDVSTDQDLYQVGFEAGWEPSEDGRLVLMRPLYRDSVWNGMRRIQGLPVVSDLQLVLDLWHYPLRGREQAEHMIDSVLFRGHG